MINSLPDSLEKIYLKCANCVESKMTNSSFKNNRIRSKPILDILHTDSNDLHSIASYKGERYFLTFIDDYSKCTRIWWLKTESQTILKIILIL